MTRFLSTPIGHRASSYTLGECLLLAAVLFGSRGEQAL